MSGAHPSKWRARNATLKAAGYLAVARLTVAMSTLEGLRPRTGRPSDARPADADAVAGFWVGRVERAAMRLPGESKCLPRALALHWLLRATGVATRIVIAIHETERDTEHAYHAWLERDGAMLIGACDRAQYRTVLTLGGESE